MKWDNSDTTPLQVGEAMKAVTAYGNQGAPAPRFHATPIAARGLGFSKNLENWETSGPIIT